MRFKSKISRMKWIILMAYCGSASAIRHDRQDKAAWKRTFLICNLKHLRKSNK